MAYAQIFTKLSVVNGTDAYSQPFAMGDDNAYRFGVTVYNNTATSLTATPQGSVDGQNWTDLTAQSSIGLGYTTWAATGVSYAMVRLKLAVVGTGTIVLAGDVYTSKQ